MTRRELFAYALMAIFGSIWIGFKYIEYKTFTYFTLNYAVFEEAAYNFWKHGTMFNYVEYFLHGAPSHMAIHFEPSIALYSLGLALTHKPWILGVMDAISWTIAGLLVVYFSKKEGKDPLIFSIIWIFNPITNTIFYDAEPVNLGLPIMVLVTYYGLKKDWKKFIMSVIALFFVKEDAGLLVIGIGMVFLNEYFIDFFEKGFSVIKDLWCGDKTGIKISLIGVLMILLSEGYIYFTYGNKWVSSIYLSGKSVIFLPKGWFFLALDIILFGIPFMKKINAGYFVGTMIIMTEALLSDRGSQVVYYYYYYAYVAAFVVVYLMFAEIDWKKYLASVFIIFVLFSPMTATINDTPLGEKLWYNSMYISVFSGYKVYFEHRDFFNNFDRNTQKYLDKEIAKEGNVCLDGRLYPHYVLRYYGKAYPMLQGWDRWMKVFPVCKTTLVIAKNDSCAYPVTKNVISVVR